MHPARPIASAHPAMAIRVIVQFGFFSAATRPPLTFLHPVPPLLHLLLVLLHHRSAGTLLRARRWPA
jgi:hypothetical protein